MIYIATVHWKNNEWMKIQLRYLTEFTQEPFRIYAAVTPDADNTADAYHYVCKTEIESHPEKLNMLAAEIAKTGKEDDILIFIDGDAFPVRDYMSEIRDLLKRYPLAAIRRDENHGDPQPHPSFCATTIGFWTKHECTWDKGYEWVNENGEKVTDVGANLLKHMMDNKIEWHPILRTNKVNLHDLWFGIYGGMIYHHGAGFRVPLSRLDRSNHGIPLDFNPYTGKDGSLLRRGARYFTRAGREKREWAKRISRVSAENRRIMGDVLGRIRRNPEFWREFV